MKCSLFQIAASLCLLAACSSLDQFEQYTASSQTSVSDEGLVKRIVFEMPEVFPGDAVSETKSSLKPSGESITFAWEATDTVGIYPNKGAQVYFLCEGGVGTNTVGFDGGGWSLRRNSTYTSYFPFVGDIYLDRKKIPVCFEGQEQIGVSSYDGARIFLASEGRSSENGALQFSFEMLNTVIRLNANLPAGTYTKVTLTVDEPEFVSSGTYDLSERTIHGIDYSNTLEISLRDFVLDRDEEVYIYLTSAPVKLAHKLVKVRFISTESIYLCEKTPSKDYTAGTWFGLNCSELQKIGFAFADPVVKELCVKNWDTDGDGEMSFAEAAAVTDIGTVFRGNNKITSFNEFQYFTGLTSLKDNTFQDCSALSSVTLPNSIKCIGNKAFYTCKSLTSLIFPDSVNSIGDDAFRNCSGLTSIVFPEGLSSVGRSAFLGCSGLTSIVFPEGLSSVGYSAFLGCSGLTSIVLPKSLSSIGANAFSGCSSLESATISGQFSITPGVLYTNRVFSDCEALKTVIFGEGITYIPDGSNTNSSRDNMFANCPNLATIILPSTLESIGDNAFRGCSGLTSIVFPESLTRIGLAAFIGCSGLTSLELPECLTSIGNYAFYNCSGLTSIHINAIALPEIANLNSSPMSVFDNTNNCPIYVPAVSMDAYKADDNWGIYSDRINAFGN